MRCASRAFFLAFFSLLAGSYAQAHQGHSKGSCAIEPNAIVSDACASYETVDNLSTSLHPLLEDVVRNSDFFSYYRLNLYNRECPYWDDSTASCGNIACAVSTVDEEDIPAIWRRRELSKLEGPKAEHPDRQKRAEREHQKPLKGDLGDNVDESCVVEYDDECDERDYCIPEDAGSPGKGDYVSLLDNPERFTGYAGDHAHSVWDSIYRENCFTKPSPPTPSMSNPLMPMMKGGLSKGGLGKSGSSLLEIPFTPDDSCLEKRVFYRIISGMHASISTHICHEYLDQTTGIWSPNLACYDERLHGHPDRISNLYFNYALVSRAIAKLSPYLQAYTFCAGDPTEDAATKSKMMSLANTVANAPSVFDEALMFRDPDMAELKADFRTRFRNVSRIMDCVGCDKCRLWGKLQTNGYGTALKVLFEFNGDTAPAHDSLPLKRTELVSLVNTMARLSKSMAALKEFREMMHTDDVATTPPRQIGYFITDNATDTAASTNRQSQTEDTNWIKGRGSGFASAKEIPNPPGQHHQEIQEDSTDPRHVEKDAYDIEAENAEDGSQGEQQREERMSEWEVSKRELRLVWAACVWVVQQWIALPGRLWIISLYQLDRLWAWWLGLYVEPPLQWEWPERDFLRDEL